MVIIIISAHSAIQRELLALKKKYKHIFSISPSLVVSFSIMYEELTKSHCHYFLVCTTVTLASWNTGRMLPEVYEVGTKIIKSNGNIVRIVCVFKDRFTNTSITWKLPSARSNQVPMCRGEECSGYPPSFVRNV